MDEKTLVYHTKLHHWNELHQLNRSGDNACQRLPKAVAHMTPEKAVEIDMWRREVNKEFIKPKKHQVKAAFWRCHYSAPTSAVPKSKTDNNRKTQSARSSSVWRNKYGSVDITSLPNYLAEMSIHYSAERTGLYHGKYVPDDHLKIMGKRQEIHIPSYPRELNSRESTDTRQSWRETNRCSSVNTARDNKNVSEKEEQFLIGNTENEPDIMSTEIKTSNVCNRSVSNKLLNVITIDDCNVNLRYRPQKVVSYKTVRFDDDLETNNSEISGDEYYPIRVSRGSAMTKLSSQNMTSLALAQRAKQQKYIRNGYHYPDGRPKSSKVGQAFDTILEEKRLGKSNGLQVKEAKFLIKDKIGDCSVSEGKGMYQRLNMALRKKMSCMVNSRWEDLRTKHSHDHSQSSGVLDEYKTDKPSSPSGLTLSLVERKR